MTVRLRPSLTDQKRQRDAYLLHEGALYEVLSYESVGPRQGNLHVRNCVTEWPAWLDYAEVERADLVREAPTQ